MPGITSRFLDFFGFARAPDPAPIPSKRVLSARRLKGVMKAVAATRIEKPNEVFKQRHIAGLAYPGSGTVAARLPVNLTKGALRGLDPWWKVDSPVRRTYADDELKENRRVGDSNVFRIKRETRDVVLLDGSTVRTIRDVFFDKDKQLHFKELSAQKEDGSIIEYNDVPKQLMPLDGIGDVTISAADDVVVTEGYPAAESLRARSIDAVGITSGTFHVPSERALDPLLAARHIVLWPDNDSAGTTLMSRVAAALYRMGARDDQLKLVTWRDGPRKGDAFDFDGSDQALQTLIAEARVLSPETRISTNSILRLSAPRSAARLSLNRNVKPPSPELVVGGLERRFRDNNVDDRYVALARKVLIGEPLTDEDRDALRDLARQPLSNEEEPQRDDQDR